MDDEATQTFGFRFTMHGTRKAQQLVALAKFSVLLVEIASSPSAQQDNQMA